MYIEAEKPRPRKATDGIVSDEFKGLRSKRADSVSSSQSSNPKTREDSCSSSSTVK